MKSSRWHFWIRALCNFTSWTPIYHSVVSPKALSCYARSPTHGFTKGFAKPDYALFLTLVCLNLRTDTGNQTYQVKNHQHLYLLIKSKIAFSSHFTTYAKALLALRVCKALCAGLDCSVEILPPETRQRNPSAQRVPSHTPQHRQDDLEETEEYGCTHCEFCGHHDGPEMRARF